MSTTREPLDYENMRLEDLITSMDRHANVDTDPLLKAAAARLVWMANDLKTMQIAVSVIQERRSALLDAEKGLFTLNTALRAAFEVVTVMQVPAVGPLNTLGPLGKATR